MNLVRYTPITRRLFERHTYHYHGSNKRKKDKHNKVEKKNGFTLRRMQQQLLFHK